MSLSKRIHLHEYEAFWRSLKQVDNIIVISNHLFIYFADLVFFITSKLLKTIPQVINLNLLILFILSQSCWE